MGWFSQYFRCRRLAHFGQKKYCTRMRLTNPPEHLQKQRRGQWVNTGWRVSFQMVCNIPATQSCKPAASRHHWGAMLAGRGWSNPVILTGVRRLTIPVTRKLKHKAIKAAFHP